MSAQPRSRVIIDNDFSGDPDDLFQLVHHVLSPSVQITAVIGSHLSPSDPFDSSCVQAENAVRIVRETLALMGREANYPVLLGSNAGLTRGDVAIPTEAAEAIVSEAMRTDTSLPLYVALGGGMTELASALLMEPRIADRLTAVWIGGGEHAALAVPPPGADPVEYNLNIDVTAAQTVFNHSTIPIWQVPRDVYRQCLVSQAELDTRVRPMGPLGAYLHERVQAVSDRAADDGRNLGETYVLGDSPLVLVTALQSAFQPDSSSSTHVTMPTPCLTDDGSYAANPSGRPLRVYTCVDQRLMFDDFYAKLAAFAGHDR